MRRIKFILLLLFCCYYKTFFAQHGKEIDSLFSILKTSKEDTSKVNILNSLSRQFYRTANSSLGMEYAHNALSLAEKLNFEPGIVRSYINIGRHYEYEGNYAEALKNHVFALKLAKEINDKRLIAYCNLLIGGDYEEQGRNHPDNSFRSNVFDEALKYDFASLRIHEDIDDKRGVSDCYNSIGGVHLDRGNFSEALKNFLVCREIAEKINDYKLIAISSCNIGDVYLRLNDYYKALENHLIGIKTAKEIGDEKVLSDSYVSVGVIYTNLKEELKARIFLSDGLSLAKKIGNKEAIIPAYGMLEKLDSVSGKWADAYKHHKLFVLYRDSLTNEQNTKKILQTQLQYEFEKKEDSLKQIQIITEINLDIQKKQKSFYLLGAILLALLALFVFFNFRNQRKVNHLMNISHAKEKAELELHSLRAQLNPHFMFNSLNAIQELILREDFDKSHTYLARFAKLLRMLVENAEKPFVSLNTELEFLELYLSLEKLRIPNLSSSITIDPSVDKTKTLIPNMVLQPYIENALWHGLSQKQGEKKLELNINKQNGVVLYDVKDNGVGRKKAAEFKSSYRKEHKSKGMELLTKRFKLLSEEFGSEIKTDICDVMANGEVEGTLVSITVPNSISEK